MRISGCWRRGTVRVPGPALAVLMALSACSGASGHSPISHPSPGGARKTWSQGARAFLYTVTPPQAGFPGPCWPGTPASPVRKRVRPRLVARWPLDRLRRAGAWACRASLYVG